MLQGGVAKREDVRDLILDGVDDLLARRGYRKMTMEDLARRVGIGKGTIYLHFPGKRELALAHVDRIAARVLGRLRAIAASRGAFEARLRAMLVARVMIRFDAVARYPESLNDLLSAVRDALLARRRGHFEREAESIAAVLADGARKRAVRGPAPLEAARALVWATNSLLPFSLSARELGERDEMEARAGLIAGLLLGGLLARPSRTPSPRSAR